MNHRPTKRQCPTTNHNVTNEILPISLGKPSLRQRLEAYYSLISPETISPSNQTEWRRKFDLIYHKYGGSERGEKALALKLEKKYGTTVRLRLTTTSTNASASSTTKANGSKQHEEEYYKLFPSQQGSGILDFTSKDFDPTAALLPNPNDNDYLRRLREENPFLFDSTGSTNPNQAVLDNVAKCHYLLPSSDPYYKEPKKQHQPITSSSTNQKGNGKIHKVPVFTAMASAFQNPSTSNNHTKTPLSLMYDLHIKRRRIRVMIRYVDCIRGTLTGYLLAFDKHMNMILRDVDEVYSSRVTTKLCHYRTHDDSHDGGIHYVGAKEGDLTKAEMELWRRSWKVENPCHRGTSSKKQYGHRRLMNDSIQKNNNDYIPNKHRYNHNHDLDDVMFKTAIKTQKDNHAPRTNVRHCSQLLVRGDNVVMVWRADAECR